MPATQRALGVTDAYRARMAQLQARAQAVTAAQWRRLHGRDLDAEHAEFVALVAAALAELQRAGARLSRGYIAAFLAAELGQPVVATGASAADEAIGTSRAGKPLTEALETSLYTTKQALATGQALEAALGLGLARAVRNAGEDVMFAARSTLDEGIATDERIIGWRRVTSGGCGACIAAATGAIQRDREVLRVHDHCRCTKEPVVAHVREKHFRSTGADLFAAMSATQQNDLLGPDKAELIRSGEVPLHALVETVPLEALPDGITEAPLEALRTH